MKPVLYIRADGNHNVGLGHLVRCLALAHMVKPLLDVVFVCESIPEKFKEELTTNGLKVIEIKSEEVFFSKLDHATLVVLDGYHFDSAYQHKIKAKGSMLAVIDDMHDKTMYADLIINHSPGIVPSQYDAQPYTQFALGASYALLRPLFLKQAKQKRLVSNPKTLLICFGGSDFKNLTQSSLEVALGFTVFSKIVVITGAAYNALSDLKSIIDTDQRVQHFHALNEIQMAAQMENADLAIVPSSGVVLEAIVAGCRVISGMYAENQRFIYENYKRAGAFVDAGGFEADNVSGAITTALSQQESAQDLIDGDSGVRIASIFQALISATEVSLRKAELHDLDATYQWAVNPVVRAYAFSQQTITLGEHSDWFTGKIKAENCVFLIAVIDKIPVGSIRFDIKEGEAVISYLIDPAHHGKGLGQAILRKGVAYLTMHRQSITVDFQKITGWVMKANIPSVKAFERLGFSKIEESDKFKFQKVIS